MAYAIYFEWSEYDQRTIEAAPEAIDVDHYEAARVKAAILYAGSTFMPVPPDGFRIVDPSGDVVYRYPEAPTH